MRASYPELGSLLAGRYRLLRVLGEGGMGIVFEALHTLTEKRVAVKWMHRHIAEKPEARARLVRAALATCRVSHPNVVEVHDVVEEGESVVLVMELLQGETLETLLERGGTPLHELVGLLLQAMRGVSAAHREGVVHHDIHPANIFLSTRAGSRDVVPKVVDFAISQVTDDRSPSLTRERTPVGTPQYMSFEQLCCAPDVDRRTDVYAFGVLLYRAATGRLPFDGRSFTEIAIKVGSAMPTPPKRLCVDLPTSLEQLILWAIARDRDKRISSMDTFICELEPFAGVHAFRAMMSVPDRAVPTVIARGFAPSLTQAPDEAPPSLPVPRKVSRARTSLVLGAASLVVGLVWTLAPDDGARVARRADATDQRTAAGESAQMPPIAGLAPADPAPLVPTLSSGLLEVDAAAPEPARPRGELGPSGHAAKPARPPRPRVLRPEDL